ncbi:MAG TPA: hypothetical protein VEG39_18095 [Clostridia bacterium]|nr:hypothetical protein [Clostridia bacterium]
MYKKIRILIFTVLVVVISAAAVYADRVDTGWKGYGLYNLNKSQVIIYNESDTITINGEDVSAVYEYTITNKSGKNITVNFGYPDNGIYKFSVHDGSKFLSYKTRNPDYLVSNYGVENLQTPDGRWYLFNMVFTPDQTRTIKVTIGAEMKKEDNDTYKLSFFKDRNYSYAIKSEKTSFSLKLADFKPYSVYELDGIKPGEISAEGSITLSFDKSYGNGASIRYQPIDRMAAGKVNASTYKKPKAIVKAFNEKKYNDAVTLCDEYIKSPADSSLNLEQVKYIRAESSRLLGKYDEYLSAVEQLDISKLYPGRIRYKILLDRLDAYSNLNNDEGIGNILKGLIPEIQQSNPYLLYWLDQNGYTLSENEQVDAAALTEPENPVISKKSKGFDILGALINFITALRESRWTYTILGLLVGFLLGRFTKRGKRKKSVYLFRD